MEEDFLSLTLKTHKCNDKQKHHFNLIKYLKKNKSWIFHINLHFEYSFRKASH